jgi:glycerol kinase
MAAFEQTAGLQLEQLNVDGGASRNDFLMQFQADVLNCPVDRSSTIESTGLGAAFLAGLAVGFWPSGAAIQKLRRSEKIFYPQIDEDERQRIYSGWMDAVGRVKSGQSG